jgi:hypothetical protein
LVCEHFSEHIRYLDILARFGHKAVPFISDL